jgi:hypothetical protein
MAMIKQSEFENCCVGLALKILDQTRTWRVLSGLALASQLGRYSSFGGIYRPIYRPNGI